jgi:hypothetical protein
VAIARGDGTIMGTWSFNLWFDVDVDLHTKESINFLKAAGIDFPRHKLEGIDPTVIGRRFAKSPLVGRGASSRPRWITFQGQYDLGYFLKLLTGWPLPQDSGAYSRALASFCPRRSEIRDTLPRGSLDSLIRERGIERVGMPHTAGSDARATLELYLQLQAFDDASTHLSSARSQTGSSSSGTSTSFKSNGFPGCEAAGGIDSSWRSSVARDQPESRDHNWQAAAAARGSGWGSLYEKEVHGYAQELYNSSSYDGAHFGPPNATAHFWNPMEAGVNSSMEDNWSSQNMSYLQSDACGYYGLPPNQQAEASPPRMAARRPQATSRPILHTSPPVSSTYTDLHTNPELQGWMGTTSTSPPPQMTSGASVPSSWYGQVPSSRWQMVDTRYGDQLRATTPCFGY